jgi:hypothetical protein
LSGVLNSGGKLVDLVQRVGAAVAVVVPELVGPFSVQLIRRNKVFGPAFGGLKGIRGAGEQRTHERRYRLRKQAA